MFLIIQNELTSGCGVPGTNRPSQSGGLYSKLSRTIAYVHERLFTQSYVFFNHGDRRRINGSEKRQGSESSRQVCVTKAPGLYESVERFVFHRVLC